jgi:rhodanese-related sulfurtransferase
MGAARTACWNDPVSIPAVSVDNIPDPLPDGLSILDVREDIEWVHGHIEGAIHIPLSQLPARIGDVPDGQTLVVCKIGGRSAQATMYLAVQGYEVVNLDGGMIDWAAAGRPMVSELDQPPHVV